jgi:hypothetical protein
MADFMSEKIGTKAEACQSGTPGLSKNQPEHVALASSIFLLYGR